MNGATTHSAPAESEAGALKPVSVPASIPAPMTDGPYRTYQLAIHIDAPVRVAVGRLGTFDFPAGDYVYTGSARRNLEARIARHLARAKKFHWHIDYLLAAPGVAICKVHRLSAPECVVNRQQAGEIVVPGFGASDCRAGCGSHLKRLPDGGAAHHRLRRDRSGRAGEQGTAPAYWREACQALSAADPVMAAIIRQHPIDSLISRGDPFGTLARSIVGQQISTKAADSVWRRFAAALPAVTPTAVLAAEAEVLRACGLSARKQEYLTDLARHFSEGSIHTNDWQAMTDADIIAELTSVRGIGVWTAEMFLIFNQMRPDVFPLDDIGLQKAAAQHYGGGERLTRKQLTCLGERWRPWRSVATWYLWRSLDPLPVDY